MKYLEKSVELIEDIKRHSTPPWNDADSYHINDLWSKFGQLNDMSPNVRWEWYSTDTILTNVTFDEICEAYKALQGS